MKRVVTEPHRSSYPDPISFQKGEVVTLGRTDSEYPGWIRTRLANGNEGWAPEKLFERNPNGSAIALNAYSARELNTDPGEELEVLRELLGWFLARNQAGEEGWVPLKTTTVV